MELEIGMGPEIGNWKLESDIGIACKSLRFSRLQRCPASVMGMLESEVGIDAAG